MPVQLLLSFLLLLELLVTSETLPSLRRIPRAIVPHVVLVLRDVLRRLVEHGLLL